MRIATWNINGLKARLDFALHWLRERKPDVVGLQELKLLEDGFPTAEFEAAGYHSVVHGQKGWNGVAILSREPAEVLQKGLPGAEEDGARLITAAIGDLTFATVYCPNGKYVGHPDFQGKLRWLDRLEAYLKAHHDPSGSLLLCGDMNLCPTFLDTWNEAALHGQIFHTDEERSCFERLLQWGLSDLYRQLFPEGRMFSWWDYRAGAFHKNQGLRIDFLLGTARLVQRVQNVEIDREYRKKKDGLTASDHAPVLADLKD